VFTFLKALYTECLKETLLITLLYCHMLAFYRRASIRSTYQVFSCSPSKTDYRKNRQPQPAQTRQVHLLSPISGKKHRKPFACKTSQRCIRSHEPFKIKKPNPKHPPSAMTGARQRNAPPATDHTVSARKGSGRGGTSTTNPTKTARRPPRKPVARERGRRGHPRGPPANFPHPPPKPHASVSLSLALIIN